MKLRAFMKSRGFMRPGPGAFTRRLRASLDTRGGLRVWTPLTLRWRTRRIKSAGPVARASAWTTTVLRPQLHLHFGIHLGMTERQRQLGLGRTGGARAAKGQQVERRETIRHTTSMVMRAFEARSRQMRLTPHVNRAPIGPAAALQRESHRRGVRNVASPPMFAPHAARRGLAASNEIASLRWRRASAQWHSVLESGGMPSRSLSRTLVHRSALAPVRRAETEAEAVHERGSAPRRQRRPAEIVWRESARPSAIGSALSGRSIAMQMAPVSQAAGATAGPEALQAQASHPRPATVRFADFEPGLVDRLTDDVIRRVERRVRIERERRGL